MHCRSLWFGVRNPAEFIRDEETIDMAENFLEELVAEWYEFQEFFVRRNVLVGPRDDGGYECELDVVAYHPEKGLVHIEPSMDCYSWDKRDKRFKKKFDAGKSYIPGLFKGLRLQKDKKIDQIAVLFYAGGEKHHSVGGGRVLLVQDLLAQIFRDLRERRVGKHAVPEKFGILRSFQFVAECRDAVFNALGEPVSHGENLAKHQPSP